MYNLCVYENKQKLILDKQKEEKLNRKLEEKRKSKHFLMKKIYLT
jgi:hypothetical protein